MKKFAAFLVTGLLVLSTTGAAIAGVTTYSDRSLFEAQGGIAFNSNFQDYGGVAQDPAGYSFPGDPFSRGGVTYTSGEKHDHWTRYFRVYDNCPSHGKFIMDTADR